MGKVHREGDGKTQRKKGIRGKEFEKKNSKKKKRGIVGRASRIYERMREAVAKEKTEGEKYQDCQKRKELGPQQNKKEKKNN